MLEAVDWGALGIEFLLGTILGGVTGYAFGKVARALALLLAVQFAAFRFLESKGIVVVHWDRLSGGLVEAETAGIDQGWLPSVLSLAAIGVGFAFGFAVGYKEA